MNISDRRVRIVVSEVVSACRVHFFHPSDCDDLQKIYNDATCQLDGMLMLFPVCPLARFIKGAQDEIHQMRQLTLYSYPDLFTGSCTHSSKDFDTLESHQ